MKRKQMSGGAKLKASGRKAVLLGLWPEDLEAIRKAAYLERRPVTNYITACAIKEALKLLNENDQAEHAAVAKKRHAKSR